MFHLEIRESSSNGGTDLASLALCRRVLRPGHGPCRTHFLLHRRLNGLAV